MMLRTCTVLAGLLLVAMLALAASAAPSVIGDELWPVLNQSQPTDMIRVVALMSDRQDVEAIRAAVRGLRSDEKQMQVWNRVSARADQSQNELLDRLYSLEQSGDVADIHSLKMANAVRFDGTPEVIRAIASRRDVYSLNLVRYQQVIPESNPTDTESNGELDEIVWGVNTVNAPAVWDMGFTGEGVLVAILDTGTNMSHHDLMDHLWDGGPSYPNHGWDFYNNDNNPADDHSHGTHVAGTVLGDGTAGSQTGVAPDATLMSLKIFNSGGNGTESDCWEALDFALQHGANVTSMSAGWFSEPPATRATFRQNYDILDAAGIVSIVAAGNEGSGSEPNNVRTPGNVPPPWLNPDQIEPGTTSGVITAGATDVNDQIAWFSSRGPVTWGNVPPFSDFDYNPGAGLFKPDVSAPGVNIKSCAWNNNTGYLDGWDGTSMATPHISGCCALLLSMDPNLSPAQIGEVLETTSVDFGSPGKDNTFGAGRLDCEQAMILAQSFSSDLFVNITPLYAEPYYIPDAGGDLIFDARVHNNYDVNTPGVVWSEALLPNGSTYHIETYNVIFHPGVDIIVHNAHQTVPGYAPTGYYEFIVKAGLTFPDFIADDQFQFVKFAWQANDQHSDWSSSGLEEVAASDEPVVTGSLPSQFTLGQAYPNPFNPATSITLALPSDELVQVAVFNALGQQVSVLQNGHLEAGHHTFTFDASSLSSGVYFISAQAGAEHAMQKIVLMK